MQEEHQPAGHVGAPVHVSAPRKSLLKGVLDGSMDLQSKESMPVVKVWSVRGVEYAIASFMLWFIAGSLTYVLVALINGQTGFTALSSPLAVMLVSVPIFAIMALRLKKAELADPSLRTESTKRKFSQITQIVSFFVCFFSLITIVGSVLSKMGGSEVELGKTIGSAIVFVVVWGALFSYYWTDERKAGK